MIKNFKNDYFNKKESVGAVEKHKMFHINGMLRNKQLDMRIDLVVLQLN